MTRLCATVEVDDTPENRAHLDALLASPRSDVWVGHGWKYGRTAETVADEYLCARATCGIDPPWRSCTSADTRVEVYGDDE